MLAFGQAVFLWGLAAVAIPVIIHLVFRRRLREIPFSTLRFLRMIDQRIMRRRRMEELLLLLLRMMLIAAVVAALARPLLKSSVFAGSGSTSVILVIDDSFSMAAASAGAQAFQRARQAALDIVKGLTAQDEVLLLTTSSADQSPPAFATDLDNVAETINRLSSSFDHATVSPALSKAIDALPTAGNALREVYVISDMQSAAWPEDAAELVRRFPRTVPATVIDAGAESFENMAITGLRVTGLGGAGEERIALEATVRNFGRTAAKGTLSVKSGGASASSPVTLSPGATIRIPLILAAKPAEEWLRVEAETGADDLSVDNAYFLPIRLGGRTRVLVVNGAPSQIPYLSESFFLEAALHAGSAGGQAAIEPVVVTPTEVERLDSLSDYAAVFMVNVARPSPGFVNSLREYVSGGGGLFMFLGDKVSAAAYNMLLGPAADERTLLPAELGEEVSAIVTADETPAQGPPFEAVSEVREQHPVFAAYVQEVDFGRTHYYKHVKLDPSESSRVLMRLAGGDPLLVEKRCGHGRVLLYAGRANTAWDNMPLKPIFLPMMLQSVQYLSSARSDRTPLTVGVPSRMPAVLAGEDGVRLDDYTGENALILPAAGGRFEAEVRRQGQVLWAEAPALPSPGFYELTTRVGDRNVTRLLAANVNPAESDLSRIPADHPLYDVPRLRVLHAMSGVAEQIERRREGLPLWHWFFVLAFLLAAAECYLANVRLRR